jgi:hypothetical protein
MLVDVMSCAGMIKTITLREVPECHEVTRSDFRPQIQAQFSGGLRIMNTNYFHMFIYPFTRNLKVISHIGKHIAASALPWRELS